MMILSRSKVSPLVHDHCVQYNDVAGSPAAARKRSHAKRQVSRDAGGRGGANDESEDFRLDHYRIDTDSETVKKQFFGGARGVKMTPHEWTKGNDLFQTNGGRGGVRKEQLCGDDEYALKEMRNHLKSFRFESFRY